MSGQIEKPMLFSAPMVKALLDGSKTQTRRLVKPRHETGVITGPASEPGHAIESWGGGQWNIPSHTECLPCPHPKGSLIYVKETFHITKGAQRWADGTILYRADHGTKIGGPYVDCCRWKPSIFMPKAASRITLQVDDVRVERVQDISEEDAKAEGVKPPGDWMDYDTRKKYDSIFKAHGTSHFVTGFRLLWDSINGKKAPWALNPWVWVYQFHRIKP